MKELSEFEEDPKSGAENKTSGKKNKRRGGRKSDSDGGNTSSDNYQTSDEDKGIGSRSGAARRKLRKSRLNK